MTYFLYAFSIEGAELINLSLFYQLQELCSDVLYDYHHLCRWALWTALLEGSHDPALGLQPSLGQIASKNFLAATCLSFCYQIWIWKHLSICISPFEIAVSRTSEFQWGPRMVLCSLQSCGECPLFLKHFQFRDGAACSLSPPCWAALQVTDGICS